jgi:branched-chain amino acid transport system permease protein
LAALARILLLLARLLLAATLLLAGLLTRVLVLLTRFLVLLARVLILIAHSGSPFVECSRDQPGRRSLVAKGTQFRRGFNVAADCRDGDAGTGFGNNPVQAFWMRPGAVAAPGSHVRKRHDTASKAARGPAPRHVRLTAAMDYFAQQLINGLVLGSIYGLIAIGYTMVYGIVGMINFAHGDIFMIGGFIALITFLVLVSFGLTFVPVILLIVLLVSMAITALYGWTVERIAYRPLRHSFRLAPMLSAIGMSFVLTNYSQVAQGARVKPVPPIITGGYTLHEGAGGFVVQLSNIQIVVVLTTIVLLALFTWLVARTRLGRDMRACEQDQTMAALLGVDVDRTISMTFVIGAALAAVAGMMYLLYYGLVDFFMGFVAGIKAFTAAVLGGIGSLPGAMLGGLAIGLIETFWSAYFSVEYKDVAAFSILIVVLIFLPTGLLGRPEVEKV